MLRVGSSQYFSANVHVVRSLRLSATFCNECGEKAYNNVNFISNCGSISNRSIFFPIIVLGDLERLGYL